MHLECHCLSYQPISIQSNVCLHPSGHAPGALERRPDGIQSHGGVRCLLLQSENVLLSGGSDGYVIKWDVSKGDLGAPLQRIPMLRPDQVGVCDFWHDVLHKDVRVGRWICVCAACVCLCVRQEGT